MVKKILKPRNPVARQLHDPRFKKRVVKNKKTYDRNKFKSLDRRSGDLFV